MARAGIQLEAVWSNPLLAKICRVSLATSGISFCWLAEIQMSFFPCASHFGGEMSHLPHSFSWDRLLLLADGSSGPILPLLFFPGRADAKVLSPGRRTCWAQCCSHPACGELLCTPAQRWPILAPISTFWSPGPCAWSHKSTASADLGRCAPPAGSPAPSLPSLPPGHTEAQPETRGAQGCVLFFFQISLRQCHRSSLLMPRVQLS